MSDKRPMPLPAKIGLGLVVLLAVLLAFWLAKPDDMANNNLNEPVDANSPATTQEQTTDKSPDPVKESGPPSGDNVPSRSGTGPGPEGDIISQPSNP